MNYTQPHTFTGPLSEHRHPDCGGGGDLGLCIQVSYQGPVAHGYILTGDCLPGVSPTVEVIKLPIFLKPLYKEIGLYL